MMLTLINAKPLSKPFNDRVNVLLPRARDEHDHAVRVHQCAIGNWGLTKLSVLIYIQNVPEIGVIIA